MPLHPDFLTRPIAHRGLHGAGIPENSLPAFRAAIEAGYGIELDIQPASDGTPMVFHDYDLSRLAGSEAFIADTDPDELAETRLLGTQAHIPTLAEVLRLTDGQVPLLVEIKDQDGRLGPEIGALHLRVAEQLAQAKGPVAVMSFSPHVMAALAQSHPQLARGLVTCGYDAEDWPMLDAPTLQRLGALEGAEDLALDFISHDHRDLENPAIARLTAQGVKLLCWTIRSPEQSEAARRIAANITFEGFRP